VLASTTAARALTSSAVTGAGSIAAATDADVSALVAAGPVALGAGTNWVRARYQAVTPWRVSTAKPSGNA